MQGTLEGHSALVLNEQEFLHLDRHEKVIKLVHDRLRGIRLSIWNIGTHKYNNGISRCYVKKEGKYTLALEVKVERKKSKELGEHYGLLYLVVDVIMNGVRIIVG